LLRATDARHSTRVEPTVSVTAMAFRVAARAAARRPLLSAPVLGGALAAARYASRGASVSAEAPAAASAAAAAAAAAAPAAVPTASPPPDEAGVSSVVLYVYESCPFCNKVLQYCNAARVPYVVVEVDPLWKTQLSWASDWGKVPVAVINGRRVVDSSAIIDYLETLLARGAAADTAAAAAGAASGKSAPSPYLRGLRPLGAGTPEEAQWRGWVDSWLVRTLSPNIYRTPGEAWEAFGYLTQRNFSAATALPARVVGSVAMYALSGRLKKKYGITDERAALTDALRAWVDAVGPARPFMGGTGGPNLADVAVYGVLQGIRTTQTERDVLAAVPQLAPWMDRMAAATGTQPLSAGGSLAGRREGSLEHRVGEAPVKSAPAAPAAAA
jgi:microsomal prostaglandin-E synthase 2